MKNSFLILAFLLLNILIACSGQFNKKDGLGSFDISPNDSQIVYSFTKSGESSIYILNINNGNSRKLISATANDNYYNPKYSPNGEKILFIENKKNSVNSALCIANVDDANIKRLTDSNEIITEATFSVDGKQIYFCKANSYDKYSPIGSRDAHNFDIYSFGIEDKELTKLTNLQLYGLSNISEIDSGYILFHIEAGSNGGMHLLSIEKETNLSKIIPKNNPRNDASLYYSPIYSDSLKMIAFKAPYELYIMGLQDRSAKIVLSNKVGHNFRNIVFYKSQPKILFSKVGSSNLFTTNLDGSVVNTIPVNIE
jgi:Tol biopolymer transport system component